MPERVRTLQMEFQLRLSRLITTIHGFMNNTDSATERDYADLAFIKLCVENIENISNENLDWYVPNI